MYHRAMVRLRLLAILLLPALAHAHAPDDPFGEVGDEIGTIHVDLAASDDCLRCHAGVDPPARVAPGDTWSGSMKANSFRDPLFQAALAVTNQDLIDAGVFCLRCHAPAGWVMGRGTPANGALLTPSDRQGQTCAFCHRLDAGEMRMIPGPLVGQGSYYLFDDDVSRGTLGDVQSPHPTAFSKYLSSSWSCAGCHSAANPVRAWVDAADPDLDLGPRTPIDRTFQEWRDSAFQSERVECQTCHMPRSAGRLAQDPVARLRPDVARHDFAGGNAWGARLLDAAFPGERPDAFAYAHDRAEEMLRTAARLSIAGLPETLDADHSTPFTVRVENLTGHKLPTGPTDLRRMWIEVTARVGDGQPFLVSGAYDDAQAELIDDPQLRTYEARAGTGGEGPSFHTILNDAIFVDTRIPPRGFRPYLETQPVGRDYANPDGTVRHWDDAPYLLPAPPARSGIVTVTARLMYQSVGRDYVEWLANEDVTDDLGTRLAALWAASGRAAPVEMARVVARVRLPDTPPGDEVCDGVDDDRDGLVDEGFGAVACGIGACARRLDACRDGALRDCEPGAPSRETCNGVDDDCDGAVDEEVPDVVCGVGACRREVAACGGGACVPGQPGHETCDGTDEDCDGDVDEGFGTVSCGVGACNREMPACRDGAFRDCEPGAPAVEACNAVDDDCDGVVDEDCVVDAAVLDAAVDATVPDAAPVDARVPDAAVPDGRAPDAALTDAALPDARVADAARPDAALPDARVPDAAARVPDAAAPVDARVPDAAASDAAPDAGPRRHHDDGCAATDAPAGPGLLLLALAWCVSRASKRTGRSCYKRGPTEEDAG
jgi:hypothetical protein